MSSCRVAVIVGTRPEAIKLAPVIRRLDASRHLTPVIVSTSQHQHLVRQVLDVFGIRIAHDLKVMRRGQTLWGLSSRLAGRLGEFLAQHRVSAVLVQGDTTSALFGGLCAYYHKIPVGHVEAGLRTGNPYAPFPEEMNRTLLGDLATWHFAPTAQAVRRLRAESVPSSQIFLTGNTIVDALRWMMRRLRSSKTETPVQFPGKRHRLILVTCHRRENFGAPMEAIARAIARIASSAPDVKVVFPVHPNPAVRQSVLPHLQAAPNVQLCEPLSYPAFLDTLRRAWLVLSDSGGVQEEATALGTPVLVLREETERAEGVKAGSLKLVGADPERIVRSTLGLLRNPKRYQAMCKASDVFGDGLASQRIVKVLERDLRR